MNDSVEVTAETPDVLELHAATMGRDLLTAIVTELSQQTEAWPRMSQQDQDRAIDRMRGTVRTLVNQMLALVYTGEHPAVKAILGGLSFGEKAILVKLQVDRQAPGRHELLDAVGKPVVLVLANPEEYTAQLEEVKAASKQTDMFEAHMGEVRRQLDDADITDSMILDALAVHYRVDLRPPTWSRVQMNVRHAAREWYRALDANPKAPMPDVLLPFRIIPGDGESPTSSKPAG